ncbi:hypothetical protein PR048_011433 [Dryococelus australis]|uniref:DDE-1 domain-containing protein n=1 Tax=Dryococelus australis TaxID=614101 RepID=A0ABQ9HLN9_9NEOP|nr:hypothetical protein PR048_011433 [Dryococelus australis]
MAANGSYMPPMLIFSRQRMKPELLNEYSHATKDTHVLLLVDGHASHTKNLDLIDIARANSVFMLCLPPHCMYKLQSLDIGFMKP